MPPSTSKRVVVYRFDRLPIQGVVNPGAYLLREGVELITSAGSLQMVPYLELKAMCFGSETARDDLFSVHKLFERRPKVPGLWTRFVFRDGDQLDGILSHNLLEWPEAGYLIVPPRSGSTRQRVFIPRLALVRTELRGVVGMPGGPQASLSKPISTSEDSQIRMFDR